MSLKRMTDRKTYNHTTYQTNVKSKYKIHKQKHMNTITKGFHACYEKANCSKALKSILKCILVYMDVLNFG